MEKLEIIKEAEKLIPETLMSGTISYNGQTMPVKEFLEGVFIRAVKDNTTPLSIVNIIQEKFASKITIKKDKKEVIKDFINNLPSFVSSIQTGPNSFLDVSEYMMGFADAMDEENLVSFGPHKKTLSELYMTVLNNTYREPTLVDKTELCVYYTEGIDKEILDSELDLGNGRKIRVYDYIVNELPTMMVSATDIKIGEQIIGLDECILSIVEHQEKELQDEKLERFNRTGENPSLVTEINERLNVELPAKLSLNEKETASLTTHSSSPEEFYYEQLVTLNDAALACQSIHSLEGLENRYEKLLVAMSTLSLGINVERLKHTLPMTFEKKKRNLIKIDANKDELIEVFKEKLNVLLATELNDLSACDILFGQVISIEQDVLEFDIVTTEVRSLIDSIKSKIAGTRIKTAELVNSAPLNYNNVVEDINDRLREIRNDFMLLNSNAMVDYGSLETKLNYSIEELKGMALSSYRNGLISKEIYDKVWRELSDLTLEMQDGYSLAA